VSFSGAGQVFQPFFTVLPEVTEGILTAYSFIAAGAEINYWIV
jgi:hypothetical protein